MIYKKLKNKLDQVYVKVEYSETIKAIIMHWVGFSTHEEIILGVETGLECLIETGSSRWIADASKMEGGFSDLNDWFVEDWTPRAQKAGLRKIAFVVSSDVFTEFSTQEYAENNPDLENPHFQSLEEAIDWIKDK